MILVIGCGFVGGTIADCLEEHDNGNYLNRSDAILYLLKKLNKYKFLRILGSLTPKFIRDSIYNFIAKNRYKWFGKYESCLIPDDEIKSKFI